MMCVLADVSSARCLQLTRWRPLEYACLTHTLTHAGREYQVDVSSVWCLQLTRRCPEEYAHRSRSSFKIAPAFAILSHRGGTRGF